MKNILFFLALTILLASCATGKKSCCEKTQKTLKTCEKVEVDSCHHHK